MGAVPLGSAGTEMAAIFGKQSWSNSSASDGVVRGWGGAASEPCPRAARPCVRPVAVPGGLRAQGGRHMPTGKRGRAADAPAPAGDDAEPSPDVRAPKRQKAARAAQGAAPATLAPAADEEMVAVAPERRAGKPSAKKWAAEQPTRPAAKAKPATKAVDKAAKHGAQGTPDEGGQGHRRQVRAPVPSRL